MKYKQNPSVFIKIGGGEPTSFCTEIAEGGLGDTVNYNLLDLNHALALACSNTRLINTKFFYNIYFIIIILGIIIEELFTMSLSYNNTYKWEATYTLYSQELASASSSRASTVVLIRSLNVTLK